MSKRKNNVCYVKPNLPSFLVKIKEQIAYKDERLADLEKRQKLSRHLETSKEREDDEKPQVVVLKEGDLTAEEAHAERKRIEKEENEKPADLSQRIIFKGKKSIDVSSKDLLSLSTSSLSKKDEKLKRKNLKVVKSKLSFNDDENEED